MHAPTSWRLPRTGPGRSRATPEREVRLIGDVFGWMGMERVRVRRVAVVEIRGVEKRILKAQARFRFLNEGQARVDDVVELSGLQLEQSIHDIYIHPGSRSSPSCK